MRRKTVKRSSSGITQREVEELREAIRGGWPWRLHEDDTFRVLPLSTKLEIVLSHLTGIFTLACGFPMDPHHQMKPCNFYARNSGRI